MNEPKEGDVLAGKFRIERVLGVGGMGMVVSAMHVHLDERVAIKFLLPEALSNAEAVTRFGREARAAVKIKSEHVARVIDVGVLDNGAPFMVMELLRGHDLSNLLRERGPLPVATAVHYVLQACEALAEAHALGIVHRDLKPSNLFLTSRADGSPCVKVLDFGISKLTSATGSDLGMTRTHAIMGSPLYMSPEQLESAKGVDPRTDIWAMGTVLYELLSGRVPFEADTMPQLCTLILHTEPPPLRQLRPEVPEQLERVIARCLKKSRAERYQSVAELASELAPFTPDVGPRSAERISRVLSSSGVSSTALMSSNYPLPTAGASTGPSQAWGTTHAARSSRVVWLGLGGAVLATLLMVVAFRAFRREGRELPEQAEQAPTRASVTAVPSSPESEPSAPPVSVGAAPPSASAVVSPAPTPLPPLSSKPPLKARPKSSANAAAARPVEAVDPLSERR